MERRYTKGFWLVSNALSSGATILNDGNAGLTVAVSATGSNNRIDITITNSDASYTFTGRLWVRLYIRDGITTNV